MLITLTKSQEMEGFQWKRLACVLQILIKLFFTSKIYTIIFAWSNTVDYIMEWGEVEWVGMRLIRMALVCELSKHLQRVLNLESGFQTLAYCLPVLILVVHSEKKRQNEETTTTMVFRSRRKQEIPPDGLSKRHSVILDNADLNADLSTICPDLSNPIFRRSLNE